MLKRKNEESESSTVKRVALDSEVVEQHDLQEDKDKTAAALVSGNEDGLSGENREGSDNGDDHGKSHSGPISSHRAVQNGDPTYVHFRMLSGIKEAAAIVGKGGETVNKIKELSGARINVSENLAGVPERIVSVRGPSEHVAKAFGLITRVILNEPLDQTSSLESKQLQLKLLFPHTLMGYIIGKKGARFREIEENSAAALKANDSILPNSTDRVLNIHGVADAIHIATYYVSQTVLQHKQFMTKTVYYNPANFQQPHQPLPTAGNNMMGGMMQGYPPMMNMMGGGPMMSMPYGKPGVAGVAGGRQQHVQIDMSKPNVMVSQFSPFQNFQPMTMEKLSQDILVPMKHIGLIIGKGGKNLNHIRNNTGSYVKVNDEVPGAKERKLTITGNQYGIQRAIVLINNKIDAEEKKQQMQQMQQQQQQEQ